MDFKIIRAIVILSLCTWCHESRAAMYETGGALNIPQNFSTSFDWKLLKALQSNKENVVVSPISVRILLGLLYSGSAGKTKAEIQNVMRFPENETLVDRMFSDILVQLQRTDPHYDLLAATRIFLTDQYSPQQKFQSNADVAYNAKIRSTDFSKPREASANINDWVDQATRGNIKKLVQPNEIKNAVMVLANTLYFKGTWQYQFRRADTHVGNFFLTPNTTVRADFMTMGERLYFVTLRDLDAKAVRLPYRGGDLAMYIMLPNARGGLDGLVERLEEDTLSLVLSLMEPVYVDVVLPKFKFHYQTDLGHILKSFGMESMFSNRASFPGIVRGDSTQLLVSRMFQKAGIVVNEEGTEAYAATDVQVVNKFGSKDQVLNVTSPFLFFVEDRRSGSILFVGKVENPLQVEPKALTLPASPRPRPNYHSVTPSASVDNDDLQDYDGAFGIPATYDAVPVPNVLTQRPYVSPPSTYRPQPQYVQPRPQQPIYTPSSSSQYEPQPQPTQDTDRFGYFDMELLNAMNMKKTGKGNVFMSPASIKTVLAMILEGAGGASRKEIMSALRVNSVDEARVNINTIHNARNGRSLQSAQALFLSDQYPSSDSLRHYAQLLERHYGASLQLLPFHEPSRAADHVNAWVANATRGFVPSVVRPENFDAAGAVLLVNALYFGGTWLREFNRNLSSVQCFQTPTEPCRKVHMMQQNSNFNYAHLPLLDAHAIELPYSDGVYSMILLVPKTPNQPRLFRELARLSVRELIEPMDSVEIVLRMPKFEIDYSDDMTNILQHLGITQIFSDRANLTGIVSTRSVKVDALIHRARVRVDEQGTVAAAVTAAEVIPLMGSSVLRVDADHPFVFLIVNRHTQSVAFAGIVDAPTQANESPIPQPAPQYPSPFVGGAGKPAYSSGNNYNNNNNAAVLGAPHAAPSTNSQRGGSSSSYRDSYYAVH